MEQHEVSKVRMRRTQQKIDELLSQYEQGGHSVKEFRQRNGLNPGNFYKWLSRRKVAGLNDHDSSGFSKLVVQSSVADHLFAEVSGIRSYQPVSAAYPKELAR